MGFLVTVVIGDGDDEGIRAVEVGVGFVGPDAGGGMDGGSAVGGGGADGVVGGGCTVFAVAECEGACDGGIAFCA